MTRDQGETREDNNNIEPNTCETVLIFKQSSNFSCRQLTEVTRPDQK